MVWEETVRTRSLVVASLSIGLLPASECVLAQDAPGQVQNLPPITVTASKPSAKPGRDQTAKRRVRAIPTVMVYPTSPLSSGDVEADKVPAAVKASPAKKAPAAKKAAKRTSKKLPAKKKPASAKRKSR